MESEETRTSGCHVIVIPFPIQGHINPMLQFSKRLAAKGLMVTFCTTTSMAKPMQASTNCVRITTISDGLEEGEKLQSVDEYLRHFKPALSLSLTELITNQNSTHCPTKLIVFDSLMPWLLEIPLQLGLQGAPFFTQSCAVSAIYYQAHHRLLKLPLEQGLGVLNLPSMPPFRIDDLPSFIYDTSLYPSLGSLFLHQYSNIQEAKWLVFNTFDQLEDKVLNWMRSQWPVKTVGPIIPSMYLDKRLEDDGDYGLSLFKPNLDACQTWLDQKEAASVVYVSFGSLASLGEEQMEEISQGLKRSNAHFIWVVRESEQQKLPTNLVEETTEKGLVVNWCNQLQVLAHQAVGCFFTHCGWNSTLEALSLGVPMAAMPQWTDQTTNSKFIADVWKVGLRVKKDESGIVRGEEIALCIREIMEGERGNEIRKNALRWKELAKEAVDEGGSSNKNIEEFVAELAEVEGDAS
ncbi:mogroside IE synthase-like [Malania oleifera]|uniref:mogroside IE synthase-like n=1 Tax=Malania oleifera TaxID=397392 RepID=UPI0025AD9F36|nr:mogroside IE synthase-like [Malania oleifera]